MSALPAIKRLLAQQSQPKRVICVSWEPSLATTRHLLLTDAGYEVLSIVGPHEIERLRSTLHADLVVLAHSVPPEEKLRAFTLLREACDAPVLSLLRPHQTKLPQADFAVEALSPSDFLAAVNQILEG